MLRSLARYQFVDRIWGQSDLDDLAKFWLCMYDAAKHSPQSTQELEQTLELRLRGFTRSKGEAVADELRSRVAGVNADVEIEFVDPDTLLAKWKSRDGDRLPVRGMGIPDLVNNPFEDLIVEIQFTVIKKDPRASAARMGATLGIIGELHNGNVAVKSVCAYPPFPTETIVWEMTSEEVRNRLLRAFDRYSSSRRINRDLARTIFNRPPVDRPAEAVAGGLSRFGLLLVETPFGRPRLPGLLIRLTLVVVAWLVFVLVLQNAFRPGEPDWHAFLGFVGGPLVVYTLVFFGLESKRLFLDHRENRGEIELHFQTVNRYAAVPLSEAGRWLSDPVVRKMTAEILEAGFVHAGDITTVPTKRAVVVHRTFYAPDGVTYLVLEFQFAGRSIDLGRWAIWPANLNSILCQTFDATGRRFETINSTPDSTTEKRKYPTTDCLLLPKNTFSLDLFRAHAQAMKEWATETKATVIRHEPVDKFIMRQEAIERELQRDYQAKPYSWRDHIRWYLQLDAKPPAKSE
jgi:hypothetical protein